MNKYTLQAIAASIFFIWARWFSSDELRPELTGLSIGIVTALIIQGILFLYNERNFLKIYWNSLVLKRNAELRLSIAYLFKIEYKGKYLLVKNNRFEIDTYQPVGGVYKYFHPEATNKLNNMKVITDSSITNDEKSEYDLRLKMTQRKHLRNFIKWFFNSIEREVDPWREFYEELIASQILSTEQFKYIYYDLVGQDIEPIHFDAYFKVDTLKYVDIYTPRFVNQKQNNKIENLLTKESDKFIWVTEDEIQKKFSRDGKRISDHAHKIFTTKKLN